ncbi:hypothetical protein [Sediminibacterium sp.]|uniref:hypothetical protein n=1 Tax=Sediminibacterium sp. TaxID=1917865 RepID=UPI0025F2969A|nr:hypothetical protein [Sediminibacterium sp.]
MVDLTKQNNISTQEIFAELQKWISFLLSKWIFILLFGILGGIIGFIYAKYSSTTYTAKLIFVLEDSKANSGSLGGLASLAGQFGVDIGSNSGGSLLSGDNIMLYFKSKSLAKEAFLSKYSNSNKSFADEYAEVYGFKRQWLENPEIGPINFNSKPDLTGKKRLYDSLIQEMINKVLESQFIVEKTDKKAGFFTVSTTMKDESLSKYYCELIVNVAINHYISIKTLRQNNSVVKLEKRVDSIGALLNKKIVAGASLQTQSKTLDINPLYNTNTLITNETTVRDKSILSSIYISALQNLELAKFTLSQETPVIQIVDRPILPLPKNRVSKSKHVLLGFVFFSFLSILMFVSKRLHSSLSIPNLNS